MLVSLVVATGVLAAADGPREYDAFLENTQELSITEGLRPDARALLSRSLVTATEPRRGVPTILFAERFPLLRPLREQGLSATEAARQHLLRYAGVYRLRAEEIGRLVVSEVHDLGKGAVIVGFAREFEGVPLLRDELDVVMTEGYELVAFTGSLSTQPRPVGEFRLNASTALATAAQHLTGTFAQPASLEPKQQRGGGWTVHQPGGVFTSPPRARRVYFDDARTLVPAWHLEVEQGGSLRALVISAVDGRILCLAELEASAAHTYKVWADSTAPFRPFDSPVGDVALPHPTGLPDEFAPASMFPNSITLDHAGLSTNDPWLPAGATELSGNNVHTYADLAAPDGLDAGDLRTPPSGAATFDYVYELDELSSASPSQRQASATQAFYVANWMHDVFYDLGFNETARNGQQDNFGRGGLGGDAVKVEVHDYSGRNNATFRTPADGEAGRMQLFIFDEPRPSTLTLTTSALEDGGMFLGAPSAVSLDRDWDVTGPVAMVTDLDGGHGGCDPWMNAASYTGSVVLLDVQPGSCSVGRRFDAAKDAGVAAVLLSVEGCFSLTEPSLVAVCVEPDAGALLSELALDGGAPLTAHLVRPSGNRERDVALDTTVVVHEYGHFITNRLVGDSLGLVNSPARGMGEGWSDFLALWFTAQASDAARPGNDQWQGVFSIGGWATGGLGWDGAVFPSHYFGVRRFPYSTDRAKNPLTFKHVGTNVPLPPASPRNVGGGPDNAETHNAGEVWASILWDAQVKLFLKQGATVDDARATMGRYLVGALKATPVLPTFIEARDALFAVVRAESPMEDFPLIQDAFAQRGLGVLAMSSDRRSTTNTPLAEDFTGSGGNYRLVSMTLDDTDDDCDADGQLDSNESGTLTVTLMNVGTRRLTRGSMRLDSSNPALQLSPTPVPVPANDPFTTVTVTVPTASGLVTGVQSSVVTLTVIDPDISLLQGRFETTATLRFNTDVIPSAREGFENDAPGWDLDGDGNFPFEQVWFVRAVNPLSHVLTGRGMDGSGNNYAMTPPLAVGAGAFTVSFTQTYTFETSTTMQYFDGGRLELSTDGENFTAVPASALSPTYNATLEQTSNPLSGEQVYGGQQATAQTVTASFGTQYANRTVWLRWRIGADDATGTSGWSIDDVQVDGVTTPPFVDTVAHRNMCTNHQPMVSGTTSVTVPERSQVVLVPGTVSDRDLDTLTVTWMQTSGTSVELNGDTFTAPEVTAAGTTLGFRVTVDDGRGGTDTDDMTVTVRNVNRAPEVTAGGSMTVTSGETATLAATGVDLDGDALSFLWQQQGDATVTIAEPTAAETTFVAPEVEIPELISFKVIALDADTSSEAAYIAITVHPKPSSCGCATVEPLLALAVLTFFARRRRK